MLIDKLAGFLLLGRTMSASTSLLETLLSGMAMIFTLGIMVNVLLASIIVGGIYVAYHSLIASNIDPATSGMLIGAFLGAVLLFVLLVIFMMIRHIRKLPRHFLSSESALTKNANILIDSFLEGFEGKPLEH